MENPIDHTIDLGFVNYVTHPENNKYIVFRFADSARSDSFEKELVAEKIWHEKSDEEKRGKTYDLFAIHTSDFKKVQQINYKVEAGHKKYIISNKPIRIIVLIFGLVVLTLTLVGYFKSKGSSGQSVKHRVEARP